MHDIADFDILALPGWHNAGPDHWMSHWQNAFPNIRRVEQRDWEAPYYPAWKSRLVDEVERCRRPILVIAHSLGTSLAMRFANEFEPGKVAGAFLVAPSDRDRFDRTPGEPVGFGPMILKPLPFRSMVLASDNDERVSFERAKAFAEAWGSILVGTGNLGHMGGAANLGVWPYGLVQLGRFVASLP